METGLERVTLCLFHGSPPLVKACDMRPVMEPSTSRESDGFLGEPVLFHPFHGENIELLEHRRRALRRVSFEKGIVFSERALLEGECFFISIEGVEGGWSGHLRIGLTTVDPETRPSIRIHVVLNGFDICPNFGPLPSDQPFFAVVDVFGNTKEVRVVFPGPRMPARLYTLCSDRLRCLCSERKCSISSLPAPLRSQLEQEWSREARDTSYYDWEGVR
ncbi:Neuralized [Ancylostoma ceylanicum]|uniref:Neuralized n=1 Tax=Ancylostoma ceylanicum TaxID=53326 RepID=A0A0D6L6P3_9BILA|nr:Neuralized [Ancylostoma ceylanicum]